MGALRSVSAVLVLGALVHYALTDGSPLIPSLASYTAASEAIEECQEYRAYLQVFAGVCGRSTRPDACDRRVINEFFMGVEPDGSACAALDCPTDLSETCSRKLAGGRY